MWKIKVSNNGSVKKAIHSKTVHSLFKFQAGEICKTIIVVSHKRITRDFTMSNFNKVILSLQKIKSKNLGQSEENLVHYMVKDYSFSNDEAEILIVDAVKANAIKSVLFNWKTSYRIVKTDNVSNATVLFPDTQEEAPEDITTEDTVILYETEVFTTTRDAATNTMPNEQEVDGVSALMPGKFNDLSDKVEKRLHDIEDQVTGMQLSNLSRNDVSGKAVTSEGFLYVDIFKNRYIKNIYQRYIKK